MNIEDLVVKYVDWITSTARRYYTNQADADDLAGETIYKLLSQADKYNSSRNFKPWALTIMENTYKTQYNRRKCVMFSGYIDCNPPSIEISDQRATVNKLLSIIRRYSRISHNIGSVLLYAKGYCYEEIAEIEGIPIGTVRSRISAGRKMLIDAIEL